MARILVVDDEPGVRSLLRRVLEGAGYEVQEASNGEEALERYRPSPADLVIMDLLMPQKQGIETIIELRKEFPAVKVIAISGVPPKGTTDFLALALRAGARQALKKPFETEALLNAVAQELQA